MSDFHEETVSRFVSLNPGHTYPASAVLHGLEAEQMRKRLALGMGFAAEVDAQSQASQSWWGARLVEALSVRDPAFSLPALLDSLGLGSPSRLYLVRVNWALYDPIEVFTLSDLSRWLPYGVWCGGSDDIQIFDDSCSWVLGLDHEGDWSFCDRNQLVVYNKQRKQQ